MSTYDRARYYAEPRGLHEFAIFDGATSRDEPCYYAHSKEECAELLDAWNAWGFPHRPPRAPARWPE